MPMTVKDQLIRPMVQSDLGLVLSWRNNPDVRRYMFTQNEITLDDHQKWYQKASLDANRHLLIFEERSVPMGFINFTEINSGNVSEWSFHAAPSAPRGSGTKLGVAALNYGFRRLGFHKVCGQVLSFNERSASLHYRLGFSREGVLRDQFFDGRDYHAVLYFGLLNSEWKALQDS